MKSEAVALRLTRDVGPSDDWWHLLERPDWQQTAPCRDLPLDLFFPHQSESAAKAKAVCAACPHRAPCLELALATCSDGVFGGTTERERRSMRAGERVGLVCVECGCRFTGKSKGQRFCSGECRDGALRRDRADYMRRMRA